jgi:hypothetical protein
VRSDESFPDDVFPGENFPGKFSDMVGDSSEGCQRVPNAFRGCGGRRERKGRAMRFSVREGPTTGCDEIVIREFRPEFKPVS